MPSNLGVVLKILLIWSLLPPFITSAGQQTGPLGGLNQFPPHMMFLTPTPRSAQTISQNSLLLAIGLDYFSVYTNAASADHEILMDMEALVTDLRLDYGVTDNFSVAARIPMVSMFDGFLDRPLEQYHQMLGAPNYGKERSPFDKFAYTIKKDDQAWFNAQNGGLNLSDPSLSTKAELLHLNHKIPTTIAMIYDVKLPLGDEASGFGSGNWDHGIFIPIQFSFSEFSVYLMPGYIRVGKPELRNPQISVRDIKSFFGGVEYLYTSNASILLQINSYTSPFVDTGIETLDLPSIELALGMRWSITERVSAEFSFNEDLTRAAPDFTLHFMLSHQFFFSE